MRVKRKFLVTHLKKHKKEENNAPDKDQVEKFYCSVCGRERLARKTMKVMMVCVGNAGMTSSLRSLMTCLEI